MAFYYGVIASVTVVWALFCIGGRTRVKDRIYLVLAFGLLLFLSAARYNVGFDYSYVYAPQYEQVLTNPAYSFADTRFEPGFVLLEKAVASVSQNYQALFVVTSAVILVLFFLYHWFHSANPFVGVFFFLTLSQFYTTMDFIRQSIAAAIVTVAAPLLKGRKPWQLVLYALAAGLAATFHLSALIVLPFILINLLPVGNKWVLAGFSAAAVLVFLFMDQVILLATRYIFPSYAGYVGNAHMTTTFTPQFAIAYGVCFLVIFLFRNSLTKRDPGNYIYVNFAFFTFFFALLGIRHAVLDRFAMYFLFTVPVAFSILLDELGKIEDGVSALVKKGRDVLRQKASYLAVAVLLFGGSLAIHQYALYMDHHGVVPYEFLWNQPFYESYREWTSAQGDEPALLESWGETL